MPCRRATWWTQTARLAEAKANPPRRPWLADAVSTTERRPRPSNRPEPPLDTISDPIYDRVMDKVVVWLVDAWKTPPMSTEARREAGFLLRQLQLGVRLAMPKARNLPNLGARVIELRIRDAAAQATWRIVCRIDADAVIVAHWFDKNDNKMPRRDVAAVLTRLARYDAAVR